MTFSNIITIIVFFLLVGCGKLIPCKDDELSLSMVDYTGDQIKLQGYYFGNLTENSTPAYAEIYYLYRNGIFFTTAASLLQEAESGTINVPLGPGEKVKRSFGLFQIDGNTIEIDRWQGSINGCEETIYETGNILNDSTFVITRREFRDNGKATNVEDANDIFRFRSLTEKPDSTNSFVP